MIIKTIEDVRRYTDNLSQKIPSIFNEIAVINKTDELSPEVINKLHLPPIYVSLATKNRFAGVSIGPFALWPSFSKKPLNQSLIEENLEDSFAKKFSDYSLISVARYEANPICIASTMSKVSDHVFLLDNTSSSELKLKYIASNFEIFLLLAANAYRISDEFEENIKKGKEEMLKCCELLECSTEQTEFWKDRAIELLAYSNQIIGVGVKNKSLKTRLILLQSTAMDRSVFI